MSSTGFNFTQPSKPTPAIERPAPPIVSQGINEGELCCKTVTQKGVKSVNYYITADTTALTAKDGTGWDVVSYNKINYTFANLVSGQRYYIKVGLVGVRGAGSYQRLYFLYPAVISLGVLVQQKGRFLTGNGLLLGVVAYL